MARAPIVPASLPEPKRARSRIRFSVGLALVLMGGLAWWGYTSAYPDWRADRALRAAQKASGESDYDAAREHLQVLLTIRPKSAQGHFLLARNSRQSDNLMTAAKELREAKNAGWARDEVELEEHLIEAQESGPRGSNEKSLHALVLARHPAERVILEALVKGYLNAHLPIAAMKWLEIWIDRFPDDWLPRQRRGETLVTLNLPDDARADFLKSLELRPRNPAALRGLGQLELRDKRDAKAAGEHFAALLEVAPDDKVGLLGMAECLRMQGDSAAAKGYLDRLLAREPRHARACLEYAAIQAEAGRPVEALDLAKRAEVTLPDEPELHYRLGAIFSQLGQPELAAPHAARSDLLGEAYRKTGEWARQLLQDPSNTELRYQIGAELLRVGRDETAVAWLSTALLEKPDHQPSHRALAAYYRKIGDAPRSAQHRRLGGSEK